MNKIRICCFIFLIFLISCNWQKRFVIKGNLENANSSKIYLAEMNLTETKIIDSAEISKKGAFKFKGKIESPGFYQLIDKPDNFLILLIEPGQKIKIKADSKNLNSRYIIEGSESSLLVKMLNDRLLKTHKTLDSIVNIINQNIDKPDFDKIYPPLNDLYIQTIKAQRSFSIGFIIEHIKSMSSIIALYQQINDSTYVLNQNRDLQYINLVSDTLKKYYPESNIVKTLWADRLRLNEKYNRLKFTLLTKKAKELYFPDIALPNIEGDTIHLNKITGKCILINFWSPLNDDCYYVLQGCKDLYPVYRKKGLEIFNVALTDDKNTWIQYLKTNGIPGINVIDEMAENSGYIKIYNFNKIPASFLIGPKKEIIGKDLFGEKLKNTLQNLLQ